MQIHVQTIGTKQVEASLLLLAKDIRPELIKSMRAASLIMERGVKRQITEQFRGGKEWRASWTSTVGVAGNSVVGIVGSPHPASRIQELGGTVRPVRRRALAIPLGKLARRRRPRDFPDLFVLPRPGKNSLLARRVGAGLQILYVLANRAVIPATHYLTRAKERTEQHVIALVGGRIEARVRRNR